MFQSLAKIAATAGSLVMLTGAPGAGKSHLAASARRSGTVWLLDTEGAAQTLLGKPGIHNDIQAVQTLSLRQLLDAIQQIKRNGKPGDAVILDSVSKVVQAMRSHAAVRAGADTGKKTSIAFDEHASVNRNLQAIYTALGELKHAGFHIIIIAHVARSYQARGNALADEGIKLLADTNAGYEADAILYVDADAEGTRTLTPILKYPRFAHLTLGIAYVADLQTIYFNGATA